MIELATITLLSFAVGILIGHAIGRWIITP